MKISIFFEMLKAFPKIDFHSFSYLYKKYLALNSNKNILLAELKNHLKNHYGNAVKDVVLFGSQARGDSKENSDYDVLIILKDNYSGKDENKILDLCYDIDMKYDILLDVHIISQGELKSLRGKQPIFINALKSGIFA